jgi:hypothetical protein
MPRSRRAPPPKPGRWSARVTRESNALDLPPGLFRGSAPEVARGLARAARASTRRKGTPYQSAMSMLSFYINRAGRKLPLERRRVLEEAKEELWKVFYPEPRERRRAAS